MEIICNIKLYLKYITLIQNIPNEIKRSINFENINREDVNKTIINSPIKTDETNIYKFGKSIRALVAILKKIIKWKLANYFFIF